MVSNEIITLEQNKSIEQLFMRYMNDHVSSDELNTLMSYFDIDENEALLKEVIAKELEAFNHSDSSADPDTKVIFERIFKQIQKNKKK